jgi:hypothetical protein
MNTSERSRQAKADRRENEIQTDFGSEAEVRRDERYGERLLQSTSGLVAQ